MEEAKKELQEALECLVDAIDGDINKEDKDFWIAQAMKHLSRLIPLIK